MNDDEIVGRVIRRLINSGEYAQWGITKWPRGEYSVSIDDMIDISEDEKDAFERMSTQTTN